MHVTFATDNAYAPLTAVAMYSVRAALPATAELHVTILADDLDRTARDFLAQTFQHHQDVVLDLVDVGELLAPLADLPIDGRLQRNYTRAIWTPLLLGSVLPRRLRRTLYLDSDTIVRRDPSELWRLDLGGNIVAAVLDDFVPTLGSPRGVSFHQDLGLSPDLGYFNSGVLLVDLDAWWKEGITHRCREILRVFHHRVLQYDQDVLNAALAGRWLPLSKEWNATSYWKAAEDCQPPYEVSLERAAIRHFAGRDKPWNPDRPVPHRAEFRQLASRTGTTDGRSWIR